MMPFLNSDHNASPQCLAYALCKDEYLESQKFDTEKPNRNTETLISLKLTTQIAKCPVANISEALGQGCSLHIFSSTAVHEHFTVSCEKSCRQKHTLKMISK